MQKFVHRFKEQEDVVAMGSAASLCIHTLFLSLFVGSLVDAKPRVLQSLLAPGHLHLCFNGTSWFQQFARFTFSDWVRGIAWSSSLSRKESVGWVSEKQTRKRVHVL